MPLRTIGISASSSALDLIKKKLQDSRTPIASLPVSAPTIAQSDVDLPRDADAAVKGLQSENSKDKSKDASGDANVLDTSSDYGDVDCGPTNEQLIIQFKEMLKEQGVAPFSKWDKELPKIAFDPRFKAIPSYSARRSLFEHYVKTCADEEPEEKRAAQKAAVEGFKQLLDSASEDGAGVDPKSKNGSDESGKANKGEDKGEGECNEAAGAEAEEEDDEEDFIMNEVKRRLKELRRNNFMVLIPEEDSCAEEEEEEGETSCGEQEWRDVEAEGRLWWGGFGTLYDKYSERMLFYDRMSMQPLIELGSETPSRSPRSRSASKKTASPLRCLSLKRIEEPEDDTEHLHPPLPFTDSNHHIETAYVAHICLSWEALHCQYTQLNHLISCQPQPPSHYNLTAQQFQQFQVLLQRFIEDEPFQQGPRPGIYARTRRSFPKLLQVPNIQGSDPKGVQEEESDLVVLAPDLILIIEAAIFTFHRFLKMDKKSSNSGFGNHTQDTTLLAHIRSSLDKKTKLKEVRKKSRRRKQKTWPQTYEDMQLLLGVVDIKIISRLVKMSRITKEQLVWCEEKMNKLDLSNGRLQRDPSPLLFPC
ncbi:uncharacterized protein LOC111023905 isoform X2 [Momordica charantia]|uniref:Uncharacterized protein LOC111023905 isoform X2 n=1 Tax=Momordica charantia TaxID=3673 RepID=A0A6J1DSH8_MOMCH|nr:uncharacterized protein LOC111023905 isoform X2 [Momordica charantia]